MSEFLLASHGGEVARQNLDNQVALVEALKQARIASGISEEMAAEALGITVSLLQAVEGFRVDLTLTDLRQYAYACNAVIEYDIKH